MFRYTKNAYRRGKRWYENSGICQDLAELIEICQFYTLFAKGNLRQTKSMSHGLRMKNWQTWPIRLQDRTEEDNNIQMRVESEVHALCGGSETKEISEILLDL